MTSEGRGILSPVRLPVPPLQQRFDSSSLLQSGDFRPAWLPACGKDRGQTELSTVRDCILLIAGWPLGTVSSVPLFATGW